MIGINVISIAQSVNLEDGLLSNILVLQLPDGTEVNAVVSEGVVDKIYALVGGSPAMQQEPASQMQAPASPPIPQEVPQQEDSNTPPTEVNWMQMDEQYLSSPLKAALKFLNVPEVMSTTAIRNMLTQISERFGEEEWAKVRAKYPNGPYEDAAMPQQAPQPPPVPPVAVYGRGLQPPMQPAPQQQPPMQQVQWSDGSPMIPGQGNRGRTVPANSAGFPITGDNSVDPGEVVAGGDGDEDGVTQF